MRNYTPPRITRIAPSPKLWNYSEKVTRHFDVSKAGTDIFLLPVVFIIIRNTERDSLGNPLTLRVRGFATAKVCKNSRRYFFILSAVPGPLRCLNMSRNVKNNKPYAPAKPRPRQQPLRLVRFKTSGEFVFTNQVQDLAFRFNTYIICFGVYRW